ncbi:sulfatase-like hydrolase/transferase [Opitutales bacterium]|nr:sulfatase-like hydrolase/transferase [Opitutales bacterium]
MIWAIQTLGATAGKSPPLDALANGGLRFTQYYNTRRCCPTRQASAGWSIGNRGAGYLPHLNNRNLTLVEVMKTAGYQTLMTGKWHVGHA